MALTNAPVELPSIQLQRVFEVLDIPSKCRTPDATPLQQVGRITFENVTFD
jgi:hypothetical protein